MKLNLHPSLELRRLLFSSLVLFQICIVTNINGAENADHWDSLMDSASLAKKEGNFSAAEKYYRESVEEAKSRFGIKHEKTALSLHGLGWVYIEVGRYPESEKLLIEAQGVAQSAKSKQLVAIIERRLGEVYAEMGRYNESEQHLRRALTLETAIAKDSEGVGYALLDLATFLSDREKKLREARRLINRAIKIFSRLPELKNPKALLLNTLAEIDTNEKRYIPAEKGFKEALRHLDTIKPVDQVTQATIWNNMAVMYTELRRYEEAERLYRQCLDLREKLYGKESPQVIKNLEDYEIMLDNAGRKAESTALKAHINQIKSRNREQSKN